GLGALVVGVMQDGKLVYAGKVGTGYTEAVATDLLAKLRKIETRTSPFVGRQPDKPATVHWVKPQLIAEVAFAGWTHDGVLRQASFKGLRDDKTAADVTVRAEPVARPRPSGPLQVMGVTISNPDKVLWPDDGITKRELAEYLAAVSARMVPFLKDRPVSIIRAPDGLGRQTFFQRHAGRGTSALIRLIRVPGEEKPYISVGDAAGLIAMAQMGAVEFHPWGCTSADIMHPDQITFDLDPAPDVPFARVVDAAKELRRRLEALGFATYPKTTGGKGLHVVVPLKPKADWAEVKAFAKALCQTMVADSPDEYVLTMAKKERTGRIFLDYLRNDLTASAVSAWSPRGRARAPVAVPLAWTAVTQALDPKAFGIRTLKAALKRADDWADFDRRRVALTSALLKKAA
ncbi:MAG: DNA ligase D, partial [Alphaproteobacteria bacterium]|nr:DNA ligase D [Alphaproteobacteria bacterium]